MFELRFRSYITVFVVALVVMFHTAPAFASITAFDAGFMRNPVPFNMQVMLPAAPVLATISKENIGPMRNAGPLKKQYILAAQRIIANLVFSKIAGGAGTIDDDKTMVRIDRQGQTSAGDLNIQVQIDGMQGASTIAAVLIPNRYFNGVTNPETMAEVQRVVRDALNASLSSLVEGAGKIFGLKGDPSN